MISSRTINTRVAHTPKVNHMKSPKKFSQKQVDLAETPLFFPEGFEKPPTGADCLPSIAATRRQLQARSPGRPFSHEQCLRHYAPGNLETQPRVDG